MSEGSTRIINETGVSCYYRLNIFVPKRSNCRSQRQHFLRRRSAAARLMRLWVRIPPKAWMSVCCECCVLSGRSLLRLADHSSRGFLPTVVHRVWYRNLVNEETMAHWRLLRKIKKKQRGVKTGQNKPATVMCRVFYCLKLDRLLMCHYNPNKQQKSSESTKLESA